MIFPSNNVLTGDEGTIKKTNNVNISDRKKVRAELRLNRKYLKATLLDALRQHEGVIFKLKKENGHFIYTFAEGQLLYRLGLSPEQVVGKQIKENLQSVEGCSEEMINALIHFYERTWEGEKNVRFEFITQDGIHTVTVLNPIKKNGKTTELIGTTTDITKALPENASKYRLIAENISDLVTVLDAQGMMQYASPSHQRILGRNPDQLVGTSRYDLIHPDDLSMMRERINAIVQHLQSCQCEYRMRHINGHWIWVESRGMPICNKLGRSEKIVLISRDITEQKEAEEILRKWERTSAIGEMAAGIAHEICNPLTALKGFVQLLKRGIVNPKYLDLMQSELAQIELVTDEFLILAKPQAKKYQRQNLIPILDSAINVMQQTQAAKCNTQILTEMNIDRLMINGDCNHLKLVFINLLKNAIEAMPEGGDILVRVRHANSKGAFIQIIDHGVGIPEEIIPKLGEPFYSLKEKGTGLGLTVSFKIIKEHQGDIHIYSTLGKGTKVEVFLPLILNEAN
jgi:PAS domain S-box-containing protein